jgi:hypothetical protein
LFVFHSSSIPVAKYLNRSNCRATL